MRTMQIRLYKFDELAEWAKNVALNSELRLMRDYVENGAREFVAKELVNNGHDKDDIIVEFNRTDEGELHGIRQRGYRRSVVSTETIRKRSSTK